MKTIFKLKTFWVITIIATLFVYVAMLNFNRLYKSEMTILIVPKSNSAMTNGEQILENLNGAFHTLSFYEKVAKNNAAFSDSALAELPDYKRKEYWEEKINISRIPNSGIIKISVWDKSRSKAEGLSVASAKEAISVSASFYNIKTDLDVRILDGPLTQEALRQNAIVFLLLSFVLSFILAFASFSFSFNIFTKEERFPKISFDFSSWTSRKNEKPYFENQEEKEKPWIVEEKIKTSEIKKTTGIIDKTRTASAPDNLPVAPEPFFKDNVLKEEKKEEREEKEKQPIIREATPEEVKERLNKLLSGRL